MSVWSRIWIDHLAGDRDALPAVVTVSGFVIWGAEIRAHPASGRADLAVVESRAPGSWFGRYARRRLITPPGNQWLLLRPPLIDE
jgi:hypothetical protein